MSDAPSGSDDRDAFLRRLEAQTEAAHAETAFWRRSAKWAASGLAAALAAILALSLYAGFVNKDTHNQGNVTRSEADQVLAIARVFLCEQQPTPKGCPPQPPRPPVSSNTQAIIDDIISHIEQVYPPPNGLR